MNLTPTPIMIGPGCVHIAPDKPLRVINEGASLEILLPPNSNELPQSVNAASAFRDVDTRFPRGSVSATLLRDDRTQVHAINTDIGSMKKGYILNLRPEPLRSDNAALPTYTRGDKFTSISICAKSTMSSVNVYWQTATE
ncbi:MAG TPA: hypothetical protein VGT08_16955, partial [Terracidiphilus sp.]|nr:hypothetical protein [Terracidiphilus sp.]